MRVEPTLNTDVVVRLQEIISHRGSMFLVAPKEFVELYEEHQKPPVAFITSEFFGNGLAFWYQGTDESGARVYQQALTTTMIRVLI